MPPCFTPLDTQKDVEKVLPHLICILWREYHTLCESDIFNKYCTIKTRIRQKIDLEYHISVRTIIVVIDVWEKLYYYHIDIIFQIRHNDNELSVPVQLSSIVHEVGLLPGLQPLTFIVSQRSKFKNSVQHHSLSACEGHCAPPPTQ